MITGSKVHRYLQCLGAAVLPEVQHAESAPDAQRGIIIHEFLRDAPTIGVELALAKVKDEKLRAYCASLDLSTVPAGSPESFRYEVAIAYNPITDEGAFIDDDGYGSLGDWVYGTIDTLGVTSDAVVVYDYKTGAQWQEKPTEHDQLLTYGLAAARALRKKRAVLGIIKLDENAEARLFSEVIDERALNRHAEVLEKLMFDVMQEREKPPHLVTVTEGPACWRCPCAERCPAKMNALRSAMNEPVDEVLSVIATMTPEQVAQVFLRLEVLEAAAKTVRARLEEYVERNGALVLPDVGEGKKQKAQRWGPREENRPTFDVEKVREVLTRHYGAETANEAITVPKPETSKYAIEEAIASWWRKQNAGRTRGAGKVQDAALAQLEEAKAMLRSTITKFKRYTPKADELLADGLKSNVAAITEGEPHVEE